MVPEVITKCILRLVKAYDALTQVSEQSTSAVSFESSKLASKPHAWFSRYLVTPSTRNLRCASTPIGGYFGKGCADFGAVLDLGAV